jgi:hypothetical protein
VSRGTKTQAAPTSPRAGVGSNRAASPATSPMGAPPPASARQCCAACGTGRTTRLPPRGSLAHGTRLAWPTTRQIVPKRGAHPCTTVVGWLAQTASARAPGRLNAAPSPAPPRPPESAPGRPERASAPRPLTSAVEYRERSHENVLNTPLSLRVPRLGPSTRNQSPECRKGPRSHGAIGHRRPLRVDAEVDGRTVVDCV